MNNGSRKGFAQCVPSKSRHQNSHTFDIKSAHETEACKRFLFLYNLETTENINFLRQGNPKDNEPDCICSDNTAIELVGIYDNEYQAEKIWASARGKNTFKQADIRLLTLDNLQNEVGQKLHKLSSGNYNGFSGKIILLCNLQSPLLESMEVERYIEEHTPFRNDGFFERYFEEVWVTWHNTNGKWKIKQLE